MAPPRKPPRTTSPIQHANLLIDDAVQLGPPIFLVGASGGKDSQCTLHLVCEARKRHPALQVGALYWYRVPDIDCMERPIRETCERLGVPLYRVPHDLLCGALIGAINREFTVETNEVPALKVVDLELAGKVRFAAHLSGIPEREIFDDQGKVRVSLKDFRVNPFGIWMAYGHRQNESLERKGMLSGFRNQLNEFGVKSGGRLGFDPKSRRIYPLATWDRKNALTYVRHFHLPLAESFGRGDTSGLDPNNPEVLRYLRDRYPEDFARVVRLFPRVAGLLNQ